MSIRWYICPYDIVVEPDMTYRRCAMDRYLQQTEALPSWEEVEILSNHTLVKLDASAAIHAMIQADGDFQVLDNPNSQTVTDLLQKLGYTRGEQDKKRTSLDELLDTLQAAGRNLIRKDFTIDLVRKTWSRPLGNLKTSRTVEAK